MEQQIIITITKVKGTNVSYSGSMFHGCALSNFPDKPNVGDKYILTFDAKYPGKIISLSPLSKVSE